MGMGHIDLHPGLALLVLPLGNPTLLGGRDSIPAHNDSESQVRGSPKFSVPDSDSSHELFLWIPGLDSTRG